jgi:hypothetical protein
MNAKGAGTRSHEFKTLLPKHCFVEKDLVLSKQKGQKYSFVNLVLKGH